MSKFVSSDNYNGSMRIDANSAKKPIYVSRFSLTCDIVAGRAPLFTPTCRRVVRGGGREVEKQSCAVLRLLLTLVPQLLPINVADDQGSFLLS